MADKIKIDETMDDFFSNTKGFFEHHLKSFPSQKIICKELNEVVLKKDWEAYIQCLSRMVDDPIFKNVDDNYLMEEMFMNVVNPFTILQKGYDKKFFRIWMKCATVTAGSYETAESNLKRMDGDPLCNKLLREFAKIAKAEIKMIYEKDKGVLKVLDSLKQKYVKTDETVDTKILQELLRVYGVYYSKVQDFDLAFRAGMQELNLRVKNKDSSTDESVKLSVQLCMAAIFGKSTYNLHEFTVEHEDVFNSLLGTSYEWLHFIVTSLSKG